MLWIFILSCSPHVRLRNVHTNEKLLSHKVCEKSNKARLKNKRNNLVIDATLNHAAQKYANVLRSGTFFSHTNMQDSSHRTPLERVLQAGGVPATTAENLAKISILQIPVQNTRLRVVDHKTSQYTKLGEEVIIPHHTNDSASTSIVQSWMNSKVHRENMLYPTMTHMGCGVSIMSLPEKVPMIIAVQILQSQ